MLKDKERHIPTSGFNVVGVDTYELPGEQMYLIGHYPTREGAEVALKRWMRRNRGDIAYVYGPDDH